MRTNLAESVEQLSSAVVVADAADLQALAELHTRIQAVTAAAGGLPESSAAGNTPAVSAHAIQSVTTRAEQLVEQIILSEVADAAAALAEVSRLVEEICHIATGHFDNAPRPTPVLQPIACAASTTQTPSDAERFIEDPIKPDDAPLVLEFVGEAASHLESAESSLLKLEDDPDDVELLNTVFRAFHTIKGVAGFLNLRQIGAVRTGLKTSSICFARASFHFKARTWMSSFRLWT